MILALGASSRAVSVTRTAAVVAVGGDDDRLGVLGAGQPQHLGVGRAAADGDQAGALGALERGRVLVDDHDVGGRDLVADHRGGGGPALGAVADDDGVVAHFVPPSLDFSAWRDCVVRVSTVVPIRTIRNAIRSGVITRTLTSRADGVTGVMSP